MNDHIHRIESIRKDISKTVEEAIRTAALHVADVTGSVCTESLLFLGCAPEEIEKVLQELYRTHDLERITKDGQRTYFIPEWPR